MLISSNSICICFGMLYFTIIAFYSHFQKVLDKFYWPMFNTSRNQEMKDQPSRKLTEPQMIEHIKFIAEDLFQNDQHRFTPQKYPFFRKKYYGLASRQEQELLYDMNECLDRISSRLKHAEGQQKKKDNTDVIQGFTQFLHANRKSKSREHTPVIQMIISVYSKFKQENRQIRQIIKINKSKQQKQAKEQAWGEFLKREDQREKERKRLYQHIKLAEEGYRDSLSRSRRTKTQYDSNPKLVQSRHIRQAQQGFYKLLHNTQALKRKILALRDIKGSKKEAKNGLVKTFQHKKK